MLMCCCIASTSPPPIPDHIPAYMAGEARAGAEAGAEARAEPGAAAAQGPDAPHPLAHALAGRAPPPTAPHAGTAPSQDARAVWWDSSDAWDAWDACDAAFCVLLGRTRLGPAEGAACSMC
jgi:hypothetical protein